MGISAYLDQLGTGKHKDDGADDRQVIESKSLTKSAIALCYAHEKIDESLVLVVIAGTEVTVGDALRHTSGFGNDTWDWVAFMAAENVYEVSVAALTAARRVEGFEYNDSMYQVLAARFEELAKKRIDDVLREIVGTSLFVWERDASGTPLGPNGLHMSCETARRMGQAARLLTRGKRRAVVPDDYWVLSHHPDIKTYVNGWWETSKGDLLGIGYRHYYIVVTETGVFVQLFNDDYVSEPTPEQKNFAIKATRGSLS
jgi:CubicO group peptidase (beta-lactamase class C family)